MSNRDENGTQNPISDSDSEKTEERDEAISRDNAALADERVVKKDT